MFWKKHNIEKKDLLTPGAILIGAILVSISICWSAGTLPFFNNGVNINEGDQPQAENAKEVKITKRDKAPTLGSGKVELVEFSDFLPIALYWDGHYPMFSCISGQEKLCAVITAG